MRAIALSVVLMTYTVGCNLDSGDGNGGPRPHRPVEPGPGCAALESALRNCGLITAGEFSQCEEPDDDASQCRFNCVGLISCSELTASFCSQIDIDQLPSSAFTSCALACEPPSFLCGSGEQLNGNVECDGFQDCADGSDEIDCSASQFLCVNSGVSIPNELVCDGTVHCPSGEDEADCGSGGVFVCPEGFSIPNAFVCDGDNDCGDLADEQDCTPRAELICPDNGISIPPSP